MDHKHINSTMDDETIKTHKTLTETAGRPTPTSSLSDHARFQYRLFAQNLFSLFSPSVLVVEAPFQGHCSYTLLLGSETIIQFRPPQHDLDLEVASAATDTFGALAPRTKFLGFVRTTASPYSDAADINAFIPVYTLSRLPGAPLPTIAQRVPVSPSPTRSSLDMKPLFRSLARDMFARAYHASSSSSSSCSSSSSSTVTTTTAPPLAILELGRVGRSLRKRLDLLRADLPERFQPVVERVVAGMGAIEGELPWVLTHGDLKGGNVLVGVDDCDGSRPKLELTGLVDWAEAEYLPFGVGLYGLEELLGRNETGADGRSRFRYFSDAEELREAFWEKLEDAVPELRDPEMREAVENARLLGLLLWYVPLCSVFPLKLPIVMNNRHGIAFDDGALNRVVCPGQDDEELQRLDLFLLGEDHGLACTGSSSDSESDGDINDSSFMSEGNATPTTHPHSCPADSTD